MPVLTLYESSADGHSDRKLRFFCSIVESLTDDENGVLFGFLWLGGVLFEFLTLKLPLICTFLPVFATYGITFVYQAKVILFLCTNRTTTHFSGLSEIFPEVLFLCEKGKKSAKITPDQLMLQKKTWQVYFKVLNQNAENPRGQAILWNFAKKCTFGRITDFRKNRNTGRGLNPPKPHKYSMSLT